MSAGAGEAVHPAETTRRSRRLRPWLLALAFASGFATLVIEVAGARVMAPTFGLSAVPWTAVIGVVLAALALGHHLGGRWADGGRVPLPAILAVSGVTAALPVLLSGVPAVAFAAFGFIPGALVSATLLFAPPVLCLGAVTPYLVRMGATDLVSLGRWSGDVGAAATAGSILGTFLTGFVLLTLVPLPVLLSCTAGALLLLAAAAARWLRSEGRPAPTGVVGPLALLAVLAAATGWMSGERAGVLHREETPHGSLQVTASRRADATGEIRPVRQMWQNAASSSAEWADTGEPAHVYARASLVLLEPWLAGRGATGGPGGDLDALVLGGAALTLPVSLVRREPALEVDVLELDPAATRLARDWFAYGRDTAAAARIRVLHGDARPLMAHDPRVGRYDLVYVDVFDHLVTVPWTLVTREALEDVRRHLEPGGAVMANVLSPLQGPGSAFLRRLVATFASVFAEVRVLVVGPDGTIVPADAVDPAALGNVLLVAGDGASAGLPGAHAPAAAVPAEGPALTDAWAPVEALQARVFRDGIRWR